MKELKIYFSVGVNNIQALECVCVCDEWWCKNGVEDIPYIGS